MYGHYGSDGRTFFDRIRVYGTSGWYRTENLSAGFTSAREVAVDLLIDDGLALI
jgi:uncharacterized protein YkwD